jgi:FkbM family methyltransferase
LSVRTELALLRGAGKLLRYVRYRGIGTLSKILGHIFDSDNSAVIKIGDNSSVNVYLGDYYWSRLIYDDYEYEPDIKFVLGQIINFESAFIDCGANIGYWSIMASEWISDPRRVVAVEAAAETFKRLTENCRTNGDRFICINAAVADSSGQPLEFAASKSHAGAHLTLYGQIQPDEFVETVQSITIDDLWKTYLKGFTGRVIVKIDVEGAEILALKGAAQFLKYDNVLIIYEDHSKDLNSTTTEYVLKEIDMKVYFIHLNKLIEIFDGGHFSRLKESVLQKSFKKDIGFNLLAVPKKSPLNDFLTSHTRNLNYED